MGIVAEERVHAHNNARRAKATLCAMGLGDCLLIGLKEGKGMRKRRESSQASVGLDMLFTQLDLRCVMLALRAPEPGAGAYACCQCPQQS